MSIQDVIQGLIESRDLSRDEARDVFGRIMEGELTDAQIAAVIVALRIKGETVDEITGAVEVMRSKATRIVPDSSRYTVDTCGTGGDSTHTFNISTAAAFVAAGAGALVAKHGNRSVSSKSGSADVLERLGVTVTIDAARMEECLNKIGICFLFAPLIHGAMKHAIGPRKEIGVRTIFNILGPLTNPALAENQLLGVYDRRLTLLMATVLRNAGSKRVYVVHGEDGLDEVSVSGPTSVCELRDGEIKEYSVEPADFGIQTSPISALRGDSPEVNARIIHNILSGGRGPHRDVVLVNAAFAIAASGLCDTPAEGFRLAEESIDSGKALGKLESLRKETSQ